MLNMFFTKKIRKSYIQKNRYFDWVPTCVILTLRLKTSHKYLHHLSRVINVTIGLLAMLLLPLCGFQCLYTYIISEDGGLFFVLRSHFLLFLVLKKMIEWDDAQIGCLKQRNSFTNSNMHWQGWYDQPWVVEQQKE